MDLKKIILLGLSIVIVTSSCSDEISNETPSMSRIENLSGMVQKGPFLSGTSIIIAELDSNLVQTGNAYFTQIKNDRGDFELDVELESSYVLLRADGFYFNEISGEASTSQISLYALSDISDIKTINVNILSHLEKPRIEFLVEEGMTFAAAKQQAQSEVLSIFNIASDDVRPSEQLDISQDGEDNAILLATSVMLQGYRSEGELSELLSNISKDIKEDGVLDNDTYGTQLINHARLISNDEIRANIESRYKNLELEFTIPNFEEKVENFVSNTSYEYDNYIIIPKEGVYGDNMMSDEVLNFEHGSDYSFAAYLPKGTFLRIVIRPTEEGQSMKFRPWGGTHIGWTDNQGNLPDYREFTARGNDEMVDCKIALYDGSDTELIMYKNAEKEPFKTKLITF